MKQILFGFFLTIIVFHHVNAYGNNYSVEDCIYTLDPQTEILLEKINESPPAFRNIPLDELERMVKENKHDTQIHPSIECIENIFIDGPNGKLGLRLYKPKSTSTPMPVFVYFHGGGWTAGSLNHYDYFCQELCHKSKCLLVSVDYGQAPRYTYPQPLEDCFFASTWIEENIGHKGGDPKRIAVGGDSAGGNLAAAVTLKARENKKLNFHCQILICPALNYNFDTLSYFEFSERYFISREDMKFFWNNYLAHTKNKKSQFISPLTADSLKDLPPAFLVIANFDPLRDEGLAYGLRLSKDGVFTQVKRFNSIHGFYCFKELDVSKVAISMIAQRLMDQFSITSTIDPY